MFGRWAWDWSCEQGAWKDIFVLYVRTREGFLTSLWIRDNTDPSETWYPYA